MNATPPPIIANTLPSATATSVATAGSAVIGYGATILGAKYHVPPEIVGSILGLLFTGLTSLWHRMMPSIPRA